MSVGFREAEKHDAPRVANLHAASWCSAYRGILSDTYLEREVEADRLAVWTQRLSAPNASQLVLLAEENTALLGFACVLLDADPLWGACLDNLHVDPMLKRRGLGGELLRRAAAWCHERRPAMPLHFWVYEQNAEARAFYERYGARRIECITGRLPGGGEALIIRYAWDEPAAVCVSLRSPSGRARR